MKNLKITIASDEATFDRTAAWRVVAQILANPAAVVGLSTGKTTAGMHAVIGDIYRSNPFDVSRATIFGVDEVTGVRRDYAGACYTMLRNELVDTLGIAPENFIMPPTTSDDFEGECRIFEEELRRRGGIDLQVLGLGLNGHLGFNQPGAPFGSGVRLSEMDEALEERIRRETATPPDKHLGGITLGLRSIMHSRRVLLVAKGRSKAAIVKQMLEGPVTPDVPASILQLHPDCEFLLDGESAALLTN
jgi:glucosamine-6-phosphate deaminase